jgi:hypothetical protein
MMIKFRSPLFAAAALVVVAATAPAMAGDVQTGGIPLGLGGGSTNNSFSASNVAAGVGNTAVQQIHASQKGSGQGFGGLGGVPGFSFPGLPGQTNNSASASNIAAGVNNTAFQQLGLSQRGAPGGLVNNNLDAQNLAAGLGNFAGQKLFQTQR